MISTNLTHIYSITQDAKVGTMTKKGFSLKKYIHTLVSENAKYRQGEYCLDADTLPVHDKRILLAYFEYIDLVEDAYESESKTNALFEECKDQVQQLIDNECDEVYQKMQDEMGMMLNHHADNNEQFWVTR